MHKILTKILFNTYDLLKGQKLSNTYQQVKAANESSEPFDKEQLNKYLKFWGFNKDITQYPLMTKQDIRAITKARTFNDVDSFAVTGGSFGEPLKIPYSKKRSIIRTATFLYFNELAGYSLGDPFLLIRAKNKPSYLQWLRNETIFIPYNVSEEKISQILKEVQEKDIKFILGYPSVIYEMALHLEKPNYIGGSLPVRAIVSASEPLEDHKKKDILDAFKCNIVDRYSIEEVGMIAQQKTFDSSYHVNKFGVYTEIVNPNTNQPVNEGEQGKIVVTDVTNDLVPIVRYDTGDLGVAGSYQNGHLTTIQKIEGRTSEQIFSPEINPVSSLMLGPYIYKPLSDAGKVYQFQFAQTNKTEYELRIKAPEKDLEENIQKKILSGLKETLGSQANINIRLLDDIPPQPSGKRPVYKNEVK